MIANLSVILFFVNFWSQNLTQTYYQCLQFAITIHFNRTFLLTLALKTKTCVMTLLVMTLSKFQSWPNEKFNPNHIEIVVPYRLMMGSRLGIGTSSTNPNAWICMDVIGVGVTLAAWQVNFIQSLGNFTERPALFQFPLAMKSLQSCFYYM